MPSLNNISQLRSIEWSKKYLWEVIFDDPELNKSLSPFDKWLPAISCTDEVSNVQSKDINAVMTNFAIPLNQSKREFKLSFIDNIDLKIYFYFKKWIEESIFNNGKGLSPLEKCFRIIKLNKLNNSLELISTVEYKVYPTSLSSYSGTSEDSYHTVDVTLQKIGISKLEETSLDIGGMPIKAIVNKVAGGVSYLTK